MQDKKKHEKEQALFTWLKKLREKTDYIVNLKEIGKVYVRNGYIYATNGFALARLKNDIDLEDGVYDQNKIKLDKSIIPHYIDFIFERFDIVR